MSVPFLVAAAIPVIVMTFRSARDTALAAAGVAALAVLLRLKQARDKNNKRARLAAVCKKRNHKVIIVGSGFSGLATAIKLLEMGIPFEIIEKEDEVGGTWYVNQYPGCQVDVMSFLYGLSSYPCPKGGWGRQYSRQPEVLEYIKELVDHFKLRQYITFKTTIESIKWDAKRSMWVVQTSSGTREGFAVVSGAGGLHIPSYPMSEEKRAVFQGEKIHTATWNHDYTMKGKTVCLVGTGASAVQAIPELQKEVAKLYVVQRTPGWVLPRSDMEFSGMLRTFLSLPGMRSLMRLLVFLRNEAVYFVMVRFGGSFVTRKMMADYKTYVNSLYPTALADAMIPNFPVGCKRALVSNEYLKSLARDNVEVIPGQVHATTATDLIVKKHDNTEVSIKTDCIVWATGFSPRGIPYVMEGPKGVVATDEDAKKSSGSFYLGTMSTNYPNFFTLMGPNTGLGHNSVVAMMEAQLLVVEQVLSKIVEEDVEVVPTEQTAKRYNDSLQSRLKGSIWDSCASWYKDEDGRIDVLFPGTVTEFLFMCQKTLNFKMFDVTPRSKGGSANESKL